MLRNRQGFNLVEMMVLIGIFGLLAAISLPAFGRYTRTNRVSTSVSRLAADLQFARATAIANGRTIRVAMDGNGYQIIDTVTGNVIANRTLERGVNVDSTAVRFFPWGMADAATIDVGCDYAGHRQLNLLPTGAVEVD